MPARRFDTQLQTLGVAAQWNLLSIEQMVEDAYGDTKDDKWKATEVERIKELRGIATLDMPAPGGPLRREPKIGERCKLIQVTINFIEMEQSTFNVFIGEIMRSTGKTVFLGSSR
jgi:hypothetical protein